MMKLLGIRESLLDQKLHSILKDYPAKLPSWWDMILLQLFWGNIGFMASVRYLREIAAAVHRIDGPILECGSGLTSLLMGVLTKGKGIEIYSLEHHPEWQMRMQRMMDQFDLKHVTIVRAELKDFGSYDWYDVDKSILPDGIKLVVCDGPPGNIKGSRYGLVPEMNELLCDNCTILLDDAGRKNEREVMESWRKEHGFQFQLCGGLQKYALINRV